MIGAKEKKVTARTKTTKNQFEVQGDIALKELQYFIMRHYKIATNQEGLLKAICGLSHMIRRVYASQVETTPHFPV